MNSLLASILVTLTFCQAAVIHEEIYYGHDARPGQFPYQVLLDLQLTELTLICGGALISRNYVLTAAHCTYNSSIYQVDVYLGMTNRKDPTGVLAYSVPRSYISIHPEYDPVVYENDISIIALPEPAKLSSQIKIISLPHQSWAGPNTFLGKKITVAGFGVTDVERNPTILQYTEVTMFPFKACKRLLEKRVKGSKVLRGMSCNAIGPRNSQTCQGDSGGPLTVTISSRVYVIALVSWGDKCDTDTPSANTDVAYYLPWINEVTGIPIN